MKLDIFLIDLIQTGHVTVPDQITDFDTTVSEHSLILLKEYYDVDCLQMPHTPPAFNPDAALWASKYLFVTIQLLLLRDIGEEQMNYFLKDYIGEQSPEAVYSADLMLRFLPDIFRFGSGLSPEDPLIFKLKTTAINWPFSSVGIDDLTVEVGENILSHPSLRACYIDRIVEKKDIKRLQGHSGINLLQEVLGAHQKKLWPDLALVLNEENI